MNPALGKGEAVESTDVPVLGHIPSGVVTLADHEAHAQTILDNNAWAYFAGGAGDEITLRANRSSWDGLRLQPRVLRSLAGGHTRTELLGRTLLHPILVAPVAYQRLAHPDGELATAYAAAAQGAGLVLSTQSSVSMEVIAQAIVSDPGRGPLWFQLYMQADPGVTRQLVQRAEQAGYEALVVTVDAPTSGARDRERREHFRLPHGIFAANLPDHHQSNPIQQGQSSGVFNHLPPNTPTWANLERLQSLTRLPILLKGILHEDDARQAAQMGFSGVIVSNHGGRTLDTAPATSQVLPRIADAVAGNMAILVDGGIRRGTDVVKAIALGAHAVLVGRPCVFGLANAGAVGVAHVLRLLRDELEIAMALCGCSNIGHINRSVLFKLD